MDTLPENVKEILSKAAAAASARAEADRAEQEAEHAAKLERQREFVETTARLFVPEPLHPYLSYGFYNYQSGEDNVILEVPGIAPIVISVNTKTCSDRYGVHHLRDYYEDDELSFWYQGVESLDYALEIAQALPDRETATASAQKRSAERELEKVELDRIAAAPLEWAQRAAGFFNRDGASLEAAAAALISIAYSLINQE